MNVPRTTSVFGFLCLTCLSASSNAYSIQSQSEKSSTALEKPLNQPLFGDTATNIDWSTIDIKQDRSLQFHTTMTSTLNLPKLALQPEFQALTPKHSFINTDPSKRFTAPEPSAWIMMLVGLLGLILVRRKGNQ